MILCQAGPQFVSTEPKVDNDDPITCALLKGAQGANGWFTGPAQVTLIASDLDGTGEIAFTYYKVDGGATQTYTAPFILSGDGTHTISFGSTDQVGNIEAPPPSQTIKLDTTLPTVVPPATITVPATEAGGV